MTNTTDALRHECPVHRHLSHLGWLLDEWPWQALLFAGVLAALIDGVLTLGAIG